MELNNLKPAPGSTKNRKRIARGHGAGTGRTATRGHKGAKSRSGFKYKRNFEGGQTPLQMRLPKRGFNNPNRTVYAAINLDRLQEIVDKFGLKEVDPASLAANGIIRKKDKVKILGGGELSGKLKVTAHAFSASARESIEKNGGSVNLV